jgi:hypothetical protein
MPINTDIKEYPTYSTEGQVLKSVTLKGKEGSQIKIEAVSLQLYSGKKDVTNNTVVAVNGTPYAAWNYNIAQYSDVLTYNKYPFLVETGKDAVITWTVKTSQKGIAAKIKTTSYTYSYVDVETPVVPEEGTEKGSIIIIKYPSKSEAEEALKTIQTSYESAYIADEVKSS